MAIILVGTLSCSTQKCTEVFLISTGVKISNNFFYCNSMFQLPGGAKFEKNSIIHD